MSALVVSTTADRKHSRGTYTRYAKNSLETVLDCTETGYKSVLWLLRFLKRCRLFRNTPDYFFQMTKFKSNTDSNVYNKCGK